LYGIENEYSRELRDKIERSKREKGRGLLLSFYEFNQELRIPRLVRAMKHGMRVALVSDAGTPTISDPGFKFISEAKNNGISVEALPGPCAVTTALSACGFPSDRFQFYGYLSKTPGEREDALIEIKR
jgi:16S rRNA (cytidine1402-2'-O)-methyltransferase